MPETYIRGLTAETLADQAYESLRSAITSGELARGEKVTERGLAQQLGVSATPVREAIRRLEQDHLIERLSSRSMRITSYSPETLDEIAEIEIGLNVLVARFAAIKATPAAIRSLGEILDGADRDVAALERQLHDGEPLEPATSGRVLSSLRRFHREVELAADNPVLLRLLDQARAFSNEERLEAALTMASVGGAGARTRYRDHRDLLEAVTAHDADRAAAVMARHSSSAARDIRNVH
jgi:DNA-binding GntR family transcriptional regulator